MNEFDQFAKHVLRIKYYIRYADDFVILSTDKEYLIDLLSKIDVFLKEKLNLTLHPNKVSIRTLASGIDFQGWVSFPEHRVLRTLTKRRMLKHIKQSPTEVMLNSCLGLIKHGNTLKLRGRIVKDFILYRKAPDTIGGQVRLTCEQQRTARADASHRATKRGGGNGSPQRRRGKAR